jgi:hypothetical protein
VYGTKGGGGPKKFGNHWSRACRTTGILEIINIPTSVNIILHIVRVLVLSFIRNQLNILIRCHMVYCLYRTISYMCQFVQSHPQGIRFYNYVSLRMVLNETKHVGDITT